jgi:Flp pilus assembly protein TadB
MRGPPITINCDCGELRHVTYGDRWQCEQCGRTWNTAQIPADEYWGILRGMRRHRLTVIGVAVGVGLTFTLLAVFVAESLFLLMPAVLAAWFILYMPFWRRKVRRQARNLPKWNLRPE